MSAEAMRFVLALTIKPATLKFYMERLAFRIDNDKGYAWPAQETVAREMSVSRKTVQKLQAAAQRRGLIRATQHKGERGKFTSNHYEIPGFVDWLKHVEEDANAYFVRAVNANSAGDPPGGAAEAAVGTAGWRGPREPGGGTDRENDGVAQKDSFKREEKRLSAPQEALGVPSFAEFWAKYPRKKGAAKARNLWTKLSSQARRDAFNGLEAYCESDEVKRGFVKQGDTYLRDRVWEDAQQAQPQTKDEKIALQVTQVAFAVVGREPSVLRLNGWYCMADVPPAVLERLEPDMVEGLKAYLPPLRVQVAA